MSVTLEHIVFDAADAERLAQFWAAVLERDVDPGASTEFATIGRTGPAALQPVLMFIRVPEGRVGKNRLHIDLSSPDRTDDVARAISAGATHVADFAEYGTEWTTLRDVEGNVFDIGAGLRPE
jgi:Glyoxalase-like domain